MIPGSITGDPRTPPSKCPTVGGRASGGFLQYVQLLNPRNSMSITNTKGLLNMPGQNNCFLNSAVQVLWHLDIFRRSFRELCGHACMEDSCIFCALKELFAQFQYSQESALPPDALRRALAETFCDQRRFQLGFMDDAAECFENILMRIHFHIANNESEDMCSALHCIPHQKFAMTLVEQTVCHACGATSEPLPFTQMVHYVPSSALCSQAKLMKEKSDQMPSFSELLKRAGGLGDLRDCPSSCGAAIQIRKSLMNRPEIVSIGLVWDSERPTLEHIMDVFKTIGMSLKLQDVFHSVVDSRWASTATHQLVGIVTYYGKHYSTFFFHTKLRVWIYFDDAAVREIGPKWEQVVEKCCRGHFQPLLLLYANPHGSPVNTSTAPRIITVVPGHKKNINAKDSCVMNAQHDKNSRMFFHTSNNPRRALTPNPEVSYDISANIQPRRAVTPSGELSWSDESTNENTCAVKDNTNYNIRSCNAFDSQSLQPKSRNSEQLFSSNTVSDNSDPTKQSRISARLSVPNCSYFSDMYQQNSPVSKNSNVVLNRPASVDDILKSSGTTNAGEVDKDFCQLDENVALVGPEELLNDSTYISRKAVENVLNLQKLQRLRSATCKGGHVYVGQRNSSSSLESLDNVFVFRDKGSNGLIGPKLEFADVMNLARRRDSGNWSGDRSSASSSSTTSLDNPYICAIGKRLPNCSRTIGRPGETIQLTDPGYDSFSLSSSDSYPSAINCSPGKLGQIPEHVQTAFMPYDMSQLQYCLKDLKSNAHFPFGFKDDCDKLCTEADIFVAKSIERENVGDISMAALLSDTAAAKARAAMDVPYTSSQALAMAKMKHSMCLIRSSSLHKKMKEAEVALCRKTKESVIESSHNQLTNSNINSKILSDKISKEASENVSNDTSKDSKRNTNSTEEQSSDKSIEIYATLPKRSLKKKGALSSFVESLTGEESSDEKPVKEKTNQKINEEPKTEVQKSAIDQEKLTKSSGKKKLHSHKSLNKDSDLSDYSSEWEHTKKQSLYRTYSGPTNSKNELSDLNSSNNQTLSENSTKKQHRIRRKLMGGFMRRKNRSLPDLREGQDSGNETTRSFDDCFFTQTPVACRKKQEIKSSECSATNNHSESRKNNKSSPKASDCNKQPKKSPRTHTPPPYKPPPPITHSNSNVSTSPKRVVQHTNQEPSKDLFQSNHVIKMPNPQELLKPKISHHPPLCRDTKSHRKVSTQYLPHEHSSPNTAWLKELQMKQEELNQRRKLQEERERWLAECNAGVNDKLVSPQNSDNVRDSSFRIPSNLLDEREHLSKSPQKVKQISSPVPSSDADHLKSVRDIASKFEKSNSSVSSDETIQEFSENPHQVLQSATHLLGSSVPIDNKIYMVTPQKPNLQQSEHSRLHPSLGHRSINQVPEKSVVRENDSSKSITIDRLNGVNCAKQVYSNQSTSGCVYNPHLTDAQLTNVLRIGTNRSSFRNSNGSPDMPEDNIPRFPYILHEAKRPDKPPDYETAIQRLELLRNDRNMISFYPSSNCISFEAILEQAKRRRAPKKSVTFSDKVVLVACAGDEDNDFIPNPLLERVYKQHFLQNPQPDIAPSTNNEVDQNLKVTKVNNGIETSLSPDSKHHMQDTHKSNSQSPCHLCHKKTVDAPNLYCPDCAYYMSRFQQK